MKNIIKIQDTFEAVLFGNMFHDYLMSPDAGLVKQPKQVLYDEDDFDYEVSYQSRLVAFDHKRLN